MGKGFRLTGVTALAVVTSQQLRYIMDEEAMREKKVVQLNQDQQSYFVESEEGHQKKSQTSHHSTENQMKKDGARTRRRIESVHLGQIQQVYGLLMRRKVVEA